MVSSISVSFVNPGSGRAAGQGRYLPRWGSPHGARFPERRVPRLRPHL